MKDINASNKVVATNLRRLIKGKGLKHVSIAEKAGFTEQD